MASEKTGDRRFLSRVRAFSGFDGRAWVFPWALVFVAFALAFVEVLYSPLEIALGEYMTWTQTVRPEIGRGWELDREGSEAGRKLGQLVEENQDRQAAGLNFSDWAELPELLQTHRVFSISPQRFLELLGKLPPVIQDEVFSTVELLRLKAGGKWRRVFFISGAGTPWVYLVDANNVVLAQARLSDRFFSRCRTLKEPFTGGLNELPVFFGRAFPAALFFQVVEPAGPVRLRGIETSWVAGLSGRLTRVGVSEDSPDGVSMIGFETETDEGEVVYRVWVDSGEAHELYQALMDRSLLEEGE